MDREPMETKGTRIVACVEASTKQLNGQDSKAEPHDKQHNFHAKHVHHRLQRRQNGTLTASVSAQPPYKTLRCDKVTLIPVWREPKRTGRRHCSARAHTAGVHTLIMYVCHGQPQRQERQTYIRSKAQIKNKIHKK